MPSFCARVATMLDLPLFGWPTTAKRGRLDAVMDGPLLDQWQRFVDRHGPVRLGRP
jgi:hypothetical protein